MRRSRKELSPDSKQLSYINTITFGSQGEEIYNLVS